MTEASSPAVLADDTRASSPSDPSAGGAGDGGSIRRNRRWVAPVLVAFVLLAAMWIPVPNQLEVSVLPQDEGLLLVYPERMMHGDVPNQAFESVYGSASLWTVAAAFEVGGISLRTERMVGFGYHLLLVGALAALAWRRRGAIAALVAGLVAIVLLAPFGLVAWAWLGAIAFAAVALLLFDIAWARGSPGWWVFAAGVGLGLAVSFRADLGLAVLLVLIALAVTRRSDLRSVAAGVGVGLLPLFLNVVQAGPAAVVRGQVIEPIFRSGPGRRLPLSNLSDAEMVLLGLTIFVATAWVTIGIRELRRDRSSSAGAISLLIGAFELGMLPQVFQRADWLHLGYVACFVLATAPMLPWLVSRRVPDWVWPAVTGVVVVALSSSFSGEAYRNQAFRSLGIDHDLDAQLNADIPNEGRTIPVSVFSRDDLTAMLRAVDAQFPPGSRLFVGPHDLRRTNYNDTYLYSMLPQLTPGTFYLEMNPGVANRPGSRLASDIRGSDVLILNTLWDHYPKEPGPSRKLGSAAANRVVASDFHSVGVFGPWEVYARNEPRTARDA